MLAFVMLWAYFSFSQYLIIWSGNLPEEITWYLHRLQTSWRFVGLGLVVFHFARAVRAPAVAARSSAQPQTARQGRDRRPGRPARRSVLADRAGVSPRRHRRQLAGRLLPLSLGCALARLLRLAAARPRDPADPRSAVRRGARPNHRARRRGAAAAYERCTTRSRWTSTRPADGPSRRERRQHPRDLRVRRRAARGRGRRPRRWSGCCSGTSTAARRSERGPCVSARGRRRTGCRRSRGCRSTPRQDLRRIPRAGGRDARTATGGWTETPASCAFRSTRR